MFRKWKSQAGRPRLPENIRKLIVQMAQENPTWGQARVAAELSVKLGIYVSPRKVVARAVLGGLHHEYGGKGSPREGREELRGHCALIASPQFLMPVRAGNAAAFRLRRDERVGARTRWFLSDPSSSPARARIQRLRPLLSDNDVHIRLSGWFRSEFKTGRNYCAAQVYAGTKNAVGTISEGLRQEPGDKLRVTCISPGFVNTDFADSMTNPEIRQQTMATRDQIAIGRSHLRSSNRLMWM